MLKRKISEFLHDQRGYVMALALISMPLLLGFSLLVIDVARGNNLHTDLQNAVDALALAGARELDRGEESIARSDAVIASLLRNQARFGDGDGSGVIIDEDEVTVTYLTAIPPSDDSPIDADWITDNGTTEGMEAAYVLVRSNARPITSLWPVPVSLTNSTVNMQAEAVATYTAAACDVTPLFICNPFQGETPSFREKFVSGDLYGKQITLRGQGGSQPFPGNFGFLRVSGNGASVLGEALATNNPSACYSTNSIETEPGGNWGQVEQGLNTRFDIYGGSYGQHDDEWAYRPALNVRRGEDRPNTNQACGGYTPEPDPTKALPFPTGSVERTFAGGTLHDDDWQPGLQQYWQINHPAHTGIPDIPKNSYPGETPHVGPPSRYDIYKYEIDRTLALESAENLLGDPDRLNASGHRSPNGEHGAPQCYKGELDEDDTEDRRVIFSAVVNCTGINLSGQSTIPPERVVGFMTMFLTKPMIAQGQVKTISMEVIDFTGYDGNDSLDLSLREESVLVR